MSSDHDEPGEDWFDEVVAAEVAEAPALGAARAARILATVHAAAARPEAQPGEGAWPDVMTPAEVAAYLRVSPEELERELARMPFFEFAGRLRIRRVALEEWVEGREKRLDRDRLLAVGDDRGIGRSE